MNQKTGLLLFPKLVSYKFILTDNSCNILFVSLFLTKPMYQKTGLLMFPKLISYKFILTGNSCNILFVSLCLTKPYYVDSVSLREMMRRASSAARAVSGLDVREPEEGMAIPTLSWPPDPPPSYESVTRNVNGNIFNNLRSLLWVF